MKRTLRIMASLALVGMVLGAAGCGYTSPATDHFVRYADTAKESRSELKTEWERYKESERTRWPKKKEVTCE